MGYNGWSNWDTWETMTVLTNDQKSYNWLMAWKQNFRKKIQKGVFDMNKAVLVVKKYIIPAARGKGSAKWFGSDFVGDPDINPKNVNKNEIAEAIMRLGE